MGAGGVLVQNTCADPLLDNAREKCIRGKRALSGEPRNETKGDFYDSEDLFRLADDAAAFPAFEQGNGRAGVT